MADRTADGLPGAPGVVERLWAGELGVTGRVLDLLLAPAELAFRAIVAVRDAGYRTGALRSHVPPIPAISVGNLTVGGSGKTPLVRWVADRLVEQGHTPGIVHGGYSDDEPALHRRWFPGLPVVAERDRLRAASAAAAEGADVVVLDAAFQHRRIVRDLDIGVVDAERWSRSPRLLPRGPYREPPGALERADLILVTRRRIDAAAAAAVARSVHEVASAPVAIAQLAPGAWLTGSGAVREGRPERGIAVAGVGRPRAFFEQVAGSGVELVATMAFRDHHAYDAGDAARIRDASSGAPVVTTAKDAVKLVPLLGDADVWVLDQTVVFDEGRGVAEEAVREVGG